MNQPILRPPRAARRAAETSTSTDQPAPAYPKTRSKWIRPGWRSTLVSEETFARLKAIQTSTTDPSIDMSYLTDACVQMALENGRDEIVRRVFERFCKTRKTP